MISRGFHLSQTIPLVLCVSLAGALSGCGGADAEGHHPEVAGNASTGETHPVHILKPDHPRVLTGKFLADGTPEAVACSTCHATKEPNVSLASSAELKDFHLGLKFAHGTLSCLSCHDADNYDQLQLADGQAVAFPDVMTLCAQCHGPQHRDYQRGSHGGMTGHWDLTRGPRTRNHCTTCHDPHAPAYPKIMPVFKPLDTSPAHGSSKP